MKRVRFFGPLNKTSGYGNAVMNFAKAFSISDVPTHFNFAQNSIQKNKDFYTSLDNYSGSTDIDFYLQPPPWSRHKSSKYKIGYFYWEADTLPHSWVKKINQVDEIWAPCVMVKNACRKAGFKGPLKVVHTPGLEFEKEEPLSLELNNNFVLNDKYFKFYSIFQWHFRKGFDILLHAYYSTFSEDDNVVLILKVNPLNIGKYTLDGIKSDIAKIKKAYKKKHPLIYLSAELVSAQDISSIHYMGDCYVAPHRGEGWGMPIFDAMHAGSHIITTPYGGITDHFTDNSSNLLKFKKTPVRNMEWSPFYNPRQMWAEPSTSNLGKIMMDIYQNPDEYKYKINNAHKIVKKLNIESLAKILNREFDR